MAVKRMDNVAVVVDDLTAAIAFYEELGLELEDRMQIEGSWADLVVGLDDIRSEIVMMRTPDGHGRIELTKYHKPDGIKTEPIAVNTIGLHRIMFAVDDLEDVLVRLRPHGATLIGEVVNYNDVFLLCYVRGPGGIVIGLAQEIG